ncbi:hypothetical protein D9M70_646680 [compost metagenome]
MKGLNYRPGKNPWAARFESEGKEIWVGRFATKEEAEKAIRQRREEVHGEFANHGLHGYELEELNEATL